MFIGLLLVACGPSKEELDAQAAKAQVSYKSGEIVYLKPDSAKAVIIDHTVGYVKDPSCGCTNYSGPMEVTYSVRSKHGVETIKESLIYSLVIE